MLEYTPKKRECLKTKSRPMQAGDTTTKLQDLFKVIR
jgi:hypothetical protein